MSNPAQVALKGSYKKPHTAPAATKPHPAEDISVIVRIRRKKLIPANWDFNSHLSHAAYEKEFGADPRDADKVASFAKSARLQVTEVNLAKRTVLLTGQLADMEQAFGVSLRGTEENGRHIRVREGSIYIPADLEGVIEGVFGLDNRPAARPMFQVARKGKELISHAEAPAAFTANQLADLYGFPKGDGSGQSIAILELGGGYKPADIKSYFSSLGINPPKVTSVSIGGEKNAPTTADSADGEVMLDILVAGAVSPAAHIVVYFAANTDAGFLDAITTAIHDTQNKPSVLSISWGSAEANWTEQSLNGFNEAIQTAGMLGVTVCVASGDQGSADGVADSQVHVDFPASSPFALACGGTKLETSGNAITVETVWHESDTSASGGGVSNFFALPGYQPAAQVPLSLNTRFKGRGVPDVAADADPNTGYKVIVDGQQLVIGGTSAVAPLMAGLIARINQRNAKNAGFIHPKLYAGPSLCRDITEGNNNTTSAKTGYPATVGWDACTGLGVFSGNGF